MILLPLLFLGIYLGFVELSRILSGGGEEGFRQFAAAYAFSLVPIAIAYQMAHYYTYLLIQGQMIISLISDPLGWGWNLFGTAGFDPRYGIVGAGFVWYSQVALIVVGHVIAVYLAHVYLAAPPARPRTRPQEPAPDARLDGPLHHNEPLDPGPAHRQVGVARAGDGRARARPVEDTDLYSNGESPDLAQPMIPTSTVMPKWSHAITKVALASCCDGAHEL